MAEAIKFLELAKTRNFGQKIKFYEKLVKNWTQINILGKNENISLKLKFIPK